MGWCRAGWCEVVIDFQVTSAAALSMLSDQRDKASAPRSSNEEQGAERQAKENDEWAFVAFEGQPRLTAGKLG